MFVWLFSFGNGCLRLYGFGSIRLEIVVLHSSLGDALWGMFVWARLLDHFNLGTLGRFGEWGLAEFGGMRKG